ncbi:hypothetical protein OAF43_01185 [bacterium]|nr:hypothetical protein [bacterium]
MAFASHWAVMKRFVFLVICFAVAATLSGCSILRRSWNESGGWNKTNGYDGRDSVSDRFDNDGTSGGDPGGYGGQ